MIARYFLVAIAASFFTSSMSQECTDPGASAVRDTISGTGVSTRTIKASIAVKNVAIRVDSMTAESAQTELSSKSTKLLAYFEVNQFNKIEANVSSILPKSDGLGLRGSVG